MATYEELIGKNAGLVWGALSNDREPQSITRLKTLTDLKEKDLYMALGWLAREGKIHFIESGTQVRVQLAASEYYF